MSNRRTQGVCAHAKRCRRLLLSVAVTSLAAALGCSQPSATDPEPPQAASQPAPPKPAVSMTAVDRAEFDERIAQFKGKVVLVDFWATWCLPCLEQLPHTLALAKDRGEQLAVVTMCMEDQEAEQRAGRALATRDADPSGAAVHLLSRDGGGTAAMEAFEIPGGALPYYRVYDKSGKLRHEFALDPLAEKQFTDEDVSAAVDALLAE